MSKIKETDTIKRISDLIFLTKKIDKVDLVVVVGSKFHKIMDFVKLRFDGGISKNLVIAGKGSHNKFDGIPEAKYFLDYAKSIGLDVPNTHLELESENTRENMIYVSKLVEEKIGWEKISSILLVGKAYHSRRLYLTARTYLPNGVKIYVDGVVGKFDISKETWYETEKGREKVMGELRRIDKYHRKGDINIFNHD